MAVRRGIWRFNDGGTWDLGERTRIVGILNITPDSFSDGGLHLEPDAAIAHGLRLAEEGADAIDVGGESTRPGSQSVPEDEQIRRVVPVIRELRLQLDRRLVSSETASGPNSAGRPSARSRSQNTRANISGDTALEVAPKSLRAEPSCGPDRIRISVDTTRARVAEAAIEAGADIVNDVSGLRDDPAMAPLVARSGTAAILMHMRGSPRTMQENPRYDDLMGEIAIELGESVRLARDAGVEDDRIVLDPGIGFGKTADHNLEILARLSALVSIGRPLLIGVSRKSFLGKVTGLPVDQRLEAGLAAGAAAIMNGASILRVHDVAPTVRMARTLDAILEAGRESR